MSIKPKFQILRSLDERIKRIATDISEYEPAFAAIDFAYILGFLTGNTTNFIGLTTEPENIHNNLVVVGLVSLKKSPAISEDEVKQSLASARKLTPRLHDGDMNKDLFLVYKIDEDSGQLVKLIYNLPEESYLVDQPKLSVLVESKIYNHSALVKLTCPLKLEILDESQKLLRKERVISTIDSLMDTFRKDSTSIRIHLNKSSFSASLSEKLKPQTTESLYEHLEAPDDVLQMGDYLPQLSKSDKEKMIDKWRNKMKNQREPLEFFIEHESLNYKTGETLPKSFYGLNLELYTYLHVNDSYYKSQESIIGTILNALDTVKSPLLERSGRTLEQNEIKICTFKPDTLGHLISCMYLIPTSQVPDYDGLQEQRRLLHSRYLAPMDKPIFRHRQRIKNLYLTSDDEQAGFLCNVHADVADKSGVKGGLRSLVDGKYTYHHYMQDKISDNGWGCAYRSLQTIISWYKHQGYIYSSDVKPRVEAKEDDKTKWLREKLWVECRVPSHQEIQSVLVDVGDKQPSFIGSEKWIGSQEVCYVLDHLYGIQSKFISVSSGGELLYKARELCQHLASQGSPIMIGGGVLAHTIIGLDFNENNGDVSYLILDPHYTGAEDLALINKKGWCGWKKNTFWDKNAFYNLCLPQRLIEY